MHLLRSGMYSAASMKQKQNIKNLHGGHCDKYNWWDRMSCDAISPYWLGPPYRSP